MIFPLKKKKEKKNSLFVLYCRVWWRRVVERGRRSGVNDTSYTVVFGDGVFYNEKDERECKPPLLLWKMK